VLSHIGRFLLAIDWEDYFEGVHQVILPKATLDHFLILLRVRDSSQVDVRSNLKICGLR